MVVYKDGDISRIFDEDYNVVKLFAGITSTSLKEFGWFSMHETNIYKFTE